MILLFLDTVAPRINAVVHQYSEWGFQVALWGFSIMMAGAFVREVINAIKNI